MNEAKQTICLICGGIEGYMDRMYRAKRCHCPKVEDMQFIKDCRHEFVSREYIGQPYGTCLDCGRTVFE